MSTPHFVVVLRDLTVPLVESLCVGRDESCDIVITDDPKVSRRHAKLFDRGGVITVEDFASANGTFLNGARVITPVRVRAGDEVRVGDERLSLRRTESTRPARRSGRPARSAPPAGELPYSLPDLATEPYGVDRYHTRWLRIEDAIASKDWSLADDLLGSQFRRVRRSATESRELTSITQAKLCRYAIDMTVATGQGTWLNELFEFHVWCGRPLPEAAAEALVPIVEQVRNLDLAALRRLIDVLQAADGSFSPSERNAYASIVAAWKTAEESAGRRSE